MPQTGSEVRKRSSAFTEEEEVALATAIKDREPLLFGAFNSGSISRKGKDKAWTEVTTAVNAVGGNDRTVEQIKTKHKNLKATAKSKESHNRQTVFKTGGGNSPIQELSDPERIILQTIPEQSLTGIKGGIDLHETDLMKTSSPNVICKGPTLTLVRQEMSENYSDGRSQTNLPTTDTITDSKAASPPKRRAETPLTTPRFTKRAERKHEPSRVEKLMVEQINASRQLTSAAEKLVEAVTSKNEYEKKKLELLERLVVAHEESLSYKRRRLHNDE